MEADGEFGAGSTRGQELNAIGSNRGFSFPKSARILKPADFRLVYDKGFRVFSPYFKAFCLKHSGNQEPKVGFTLPRAFGKAVLRNRARRRFREAARLNLSRVGDGWMIVVNPRRAALDAPFPELCREVERLFARCGESS